MGATNFTTSAKGRTAEEAFRAAREDACHWHGHGGYTGSIAEKDRLVLITDDGKALRARVDAAIRALRPIARSVREGGRVEPERLHARIEREVRGVELDLGIWDLEGSKADVTKTIRRELKRLTELRNQCRARMTPSQIADVLIQIGDRRIRDKWGPAGCIDLTPRKKRDKEFLFFGWASC